MKAFRPMKGDILASPYRDQPAPNGKPGHWFGTFVEVDTHRGRALVRFYDGHPPMDLRVEQLVHDGGNSCSQVWKLKPRP